MMGALADLARRYEILFYIGLAAGAAIYLRALLRANRLLHSTVFGLEREQLYARRSAAFSMLFICLFLAVTFYIVLHLIVPAMQAQPRPSRSTPGVLFTLSAPTGPALVAPQATLSPEQITSIALGTPLPTATATPALLPAGAGCENPSATLTAPAFGQSVAGPVEVKGTANIADFAFYKLEINGPSTGGNWQTLSAGSAPVVDGVLGQWDSSIYIPGNYNFRLVVYDASGNWPPPCVVPINIVTITE
jgi:hypothetical protein